MMSAPGSERARCGSAASTTSGTGSGLKSRRCSIPAIALRRLPAPLSRRGQPGELTDPRRRCLDDIRPRRSPVIETRSCCASSRPECSGRTVRWRRSLERYRSISDARSPRRPATLFAIGPTGVGKTRAAEALAESLGDLLGGAMVILHAAQHERVPRAVTGSASYLEPRPATLDTAKALISSTCSLTQPESIVLFDEIEKAHPDIIVTLMSAMDTGELSLPARTDTRRVIDCQRAMFFFTSNLDATERDRRARLIGPRASCRYRMPTMQLMASGIKPELVGRIGAFLVFRPLSARARAEIATAAVAQVAAEYGLHVVGVAAEIISIIVNRPYDDLGARPDEYFIDDMLSGEFSRYAAAGEPTTIIVSACPGPRCIPAAEAP